MPYRNILCAVDFSDDSRAAMAAAADLARAADGTLTLLNVHHVPRIGYPQLHPEARFEEPLRALAEQTLGAWRVEAERLAGRSVTTIVDEGVAWDRIVRAAAEHRCDVLVVGNRGRTGLAHALVGSVAERVVRHATCPVLVVRAGPVHPGAGAPEASALHQP